MGEPETREEATEQEVARGAVSAHAMHNSSTGVAREGCALGEKNKSNRRPPVRNWLARIERNET